MVIRSIVFIHIKTVSSTQDPEYEKFIAIKGHDKIKQYYFQADDYNTDSNDDDDDNNEWLPYDAWWMPTTIEIMCETAMVRMIM